MLKRGSIFFRFYTFFIVLGSTDSITYTVNMLTLQRMLKNTQILWYNNQTIPAPYRRCPMSETEKIVTKTFQAGETILTEGDSGKHVYLIISGSVEIYKATGGNRQLLNTLGSGEIFGEMGILTNEPRYATVISAEESRLIVVHDKAFQAALLNDKLPIIKPLTKQLASRFREVELQNQENLKRIAHLENELSYARKKLLEYELKP
ncbi:MAG: cyclic nucleotide-binding domain-containing protein [Desulfobulbaceae bacterium]|nr:MAG: cyclic nucleotide-binding domain-containing protein [Desulfobulbaceae bacterium]